MSDGYKDLFTWLAKQNTLKPHIRELIALIAEGAENGELVRRLEAQVRAGANLISDLARKNEALESEVARLKKEYESLPSVLE